MAYAMLSTYGKANRSISAAAALLRGYNVVYPITDVERNNLVLLIACRLACSCTLGAFSYHQNPSNKYLLLHSEPAWRALELIWGYDAERRRDVTTAMNHVFHQACLYTDATVDDVIGCSDLAMPDPAIPDLLQSIRLPSIFNTGAEPKPAKRRRSSSSSRVPIPPSKPTITFVTGNAKKLEEVKRILGMEGVDESSFPFVLVNKSMDLPELQGEALNVAREKCYTAAEQLKGAVIVEDTSLCFNALNGMPGVFIKWFLDSCGLEGLNKMLVGYDNKSAYAQTIVAFSPGPGHDPVMFEGRTTGQIVSPRFGRSSGDGGTGDQQSPQHVAFGWDPIFEPDEGLGGLTYAEMSKAAKDAISHRSRAFASIRQYLERHMEQVVASLTTTSEE
jgi:inosine triphosphate pyrophosphatase